MVVVMVAVVVVVVVVVMVVMVMVVVAVKTGAYPAYIIITSNLKYCYYSTLGYLRGEGGIITQRNSPVQYPSSTNVYRTVFTYT